MKKQRKVCQGIISSRKGFTLVEVMVSLTVLAIGLLGVAMMQVYSISGNTMSREMGVATEMGQDLFEKLHSATYTSLVTDAALAAGDHPTATDVTNGWAVDTGTNNIVDERGLTVGPLLYTKTWTVTDPAAGGTFQAGTNIKTITVTVTWTDNVGELHTVTNEGTRVRR